jgi:enolase
MGKGVMQAVKNVNTILGPALIGFFFFSDQKQKNTSFLGRDPTQQAEIDNLMVQELDGSKNEWGILVLTTFVELENKKSKKGWSKSKLGANAILGCSLAIARAGAAVNKLPLYRHIGKLAGSFVFFLVVFFFCFFKHFVKPKVTNFRLPVPAFNVINGGSHAGNKLPMQEFMVLPTGAKTFKEAMQVSNFAFLFFCVGQWISGCFNSDWFGSLS